jgi:hypothetical protein
MLNSNPIENESGTFKHNKISLMDIFNDSMNSSALFLDQNDIQEKTDLALLESLK